MVRELKQHIDKQNVFFGIKQSLKNTDKLEKAFITSDCRPQIKKLLNANKVEFEELEFSKQDTSKTLELNFQCEIFGIKK